MAGLGGKQVGNLIPLAGELFGRRPDLLGGELTVLLIGDDFPVSPVGPHREPELQALRNPVLTVRDHRERHARIRGRRANDADERVDDGAGGARGRGEARAPQ